MTAEQRWMACPNMANFLNALHALDLISRDARIMTAFRMRDSKKWWSYI